MRAHFTDEETGPDSLCQVLTATQAGSSDSGLNSGLLLPM